MRRRWVLAVGLLAAMGIASVTFPEAMLSPGTLMRAHRDLDGDCLACHEPFRGPDSRCVACHEPDRIGADGPRPGFHAALADPDCAQCHTDHKGRAAPRAAAAFRHTMLREESRGRCATCHVPPDDEVHGATGGECAACHRVEGWRPATFDHERNFRFDRDHPPRCATCHPQGYRSYTCYGCHEHSEARIAREHREEGLTDIDDCARCHRSADEHEAEGRRGRGRGRGRDDDD